MSSTRDAWRARLATATAAAALLSIVATAPAVATPPRSKIVHETPNVPIVVDGVRYAPEQIHRFDGRPLYTRTPVDGNKLIAYTKLADFKAFLRKQGLRLPQVGDIAQSKAKASSSEHWARVCTDAWARGDCYTVNSGWGVAAMKALDGCFFRCWYFDNTVSSVETYGRPALLFDFVNFNYAGTSNYVQTAGFTHYVPANAQQDLSSLGWFNDRTSSMYVYW